MEESKVCEQCPSDTRRGVFGLGWQVTRRLTFMERQASSVLKKIQCLDLPQLLPKPQDSQSTSFCWWTKHSGPELQPYFSICVADIPQLMPNPF